MASPNYKKRISELGFNPPGDDHDMERTYHELVRNMASQGRSDDLPADALEKSHEYFAGFGEPSGEHSVEVDG